MDMLNSTFGLLDGDETELPIARAVRCDAPPIAVDLDGTLLRGDSLHECLLSLLVRRPWLVFPLLFAMLAGKAAFKRYVSARAALGADMPIHPELLAYLVEQKQKGRRIGLFSAADQGIVDAVASRVGPIVGETYGLGDPDRAFNFGLERILDGLALMIEDKGRRP